MKQVRDGMRDSSEEGLQILTTVRTNFYRELASCERISNSVHMSCRAANFLLSDFAVCPEEGLFCLDWAARELLLGKTQILLIATYTAVPT